MQFRIEVQTMLDGSKQYYPQCAHSGATVTVWKNIFEQPIRHKQSAFDFIANFKSRTRDETKEMTYIDVP